MANRNTLHKSKLEDFKSWLAQDGWSIEQAKGIYEVLRATKETAKYPLIIYEKDRSKEHYTIPDNCWGAFRAYMKSRKTLAIIDDEVRYWENKGMGC